MQDNSVKITIILVLVGAIFGLLFFGPYGFLVGGGVMFSFSIIFHIIASAVEKSEAEKAEKVAEKERQEGEQLKSKLLGNISENENRPDEIFIPGNEPVEGDVVGLRFYPEESCFILYNNLLPPPDSKFQTIGSIEKIFNNKKELKDFVLENNLDHYSDSNDDISGDEWMQAMLVYQFDSPEKMYKNQFYFKKSTWSNSFLLEKSKY